MITATGFLLFCFGLLGSFVTYDERKVNVCYGGMFFGCVLLIVGIAMHLARTMP